jgi:hypothetical protein
MCSTLHLEGGALVVSDCVARALFRRSWDVSVWCWFQRGIRTLQDASFPGLGCLTAWHYAAIPAQRGVFCAMRAMMSATVVAAVGALITFGTPVLESPNSLLPNFFAESPC